MDSFFGIGGSELLLILILATVVLGPLRMIRAARQIGVLLRDLRNYYTELTKGLNEELAALAELQDTVRNQVESALPKLEESQLLPESESVVRQEPEPTSPDQPEAGLSESSSPVKEDNP